MKALPIILFLLCSQVYAQSKFIGAWEGKLKVRDTISIVFHFSADSSGKLSATMDSPDQGAYGIKADSVLTEADSIKVIMKALGGSFIGIRINDSIISGVLKQGIRVPLQLKKTLKPSMKMKSQTPQPPFDYGLQEVSYTNNDHSIQLAGTITYPSAAEKEINNGGKTKYPAIILITGSGAQNRDEEIFGHKPFFVIADFLTKKGFVVLRVDDRGTGASTGNFKEATTADFLNDLEASIEFLKNFPAIDTKKIGLMGHSEGGLLAFLAAAKHKEINFVITLAGPGMPILDLMKEQNIAVLKAAGISDSAAQAYGKLYKPLAATIISATDTAAARLNARVVMDNWINSESAGIIKELGIQETFKQNVLLKQFSKEISSPWYKYFLQLDPTVSITNLSCKVLAINGDKDIQVVSKPNLDGIKAALKKSKSPGYDVISMPGLNHLFQKCNKCTVAEYGKLDETFSPEALDQIEKWLNKNVQSSK